jgi:hypothetical protein
MEHLGIQAGINSNVEDFGTYTEWWTYSWYESLGNPALHGGNGPMTTDNPPGWTDDMYIVVYTCTINTNDIAWTGSLWACYYLEDATTQVGDYYYWSFPRSAAVGGVTC